MLDDITGSVAAYNRKRFGGERIITRKRKKRPQMRKRGRGKYGHEPNDISDGNVPFGGFRATHDFYVVNVDDFGRRDWSTVQEFDYINDAYKCVMASWGVILCDRKGYILVKRANY